MPEDINLADNNTQPVEEPKIPVPPIPEEVEKPVEEPKQNLETPEIAPPPPVEVEDAPVESIAPVAEEPKVEPKTSEKPVVKEEKKEEKASKEVMSESFPTVEAKSSPSKVLMIALAVFVGIAILGIVGFFIYTKVSEPKFDTPVEPVVEEMVVEEQPSEIDELESLFKDLGDELDEIEADITFEDQLDLEEAL